ncbi:hypothetical protein CR513_28808, partial [Mucuna pruriens]
ITRVVIPRKVDNTWFSCNQLWKMKDMLLIDLLCSKGRTMTTRSKELLHFLMHVILIFGT